MFLCRKLRVRFLQLGALEAVPIGLGDDQASYGYVAEFDRWMAAVMRTLACSSFTGSAARTNMIPDDGVSTAVSTVLNAGILLCAQPTQQLILKSPYSIVRTPQDPSCSLKSNVNSSELIQSLATRRPPDCMGSQPLVASVSFCRRLTAPDWPRTVCHVQLNISDPMHDGSCYIPGDIAMVHPENSDELINRTMAVINPRSPGSHHGALSTLNGTDSLSIRRLVASRDSRLQEIQCTYESLLRYHLDMGGIPQRRFFEIMSLWATNDEERDKLHELASAEGTDLYFDYCVREKRNYVDILEDFRSCHGNISLEQFVDAIPVLKARAYSIASAPSEDSSSIGLCVAKTVDTTRRGRKRMGTCSSFLCSFINSSAVRPVYLWIKRGLFSDKLFSAIPKPGFSTAPPSTISYRKQDQVQVPLLLIGPGTGVAPLRSIIREFFHNRFQYLSELIEPDSSSKLVPAPIRLFFGCRRRGCDFLYENEWISIVSRCVDAERAFASEDKNRESTEINKRN